MIAFTRSLLFHLLVTVFTIPIGFLVTFSFFVPIRWRFSIALVWIHIVMLSCKYILGIRYQVVGRENIPDEASVVLSKHQSAWETMSLLAIFPPAVFVMKNSLLWIPFIGWSFFTLQMITIDRGLGKKALLEVIRKGKERLKLGLWIVIFPEGTRVAPGETGHYLPGGAQLAVSAGVNVIPVAHNAGEFWARNAFIKKPGLITVSIGPAITTAEKKAGEVNSLAEQWIEAEMRRISPHCYPDATRASES